MCTYEQRKDAVFNRAPEMDERTFILKRQPNHPLSQLSHAQLKEVPHWRFLQVKNCFANYTILKAETKRNAVGSTPFPDASKPTWPAAKKMRSASAANSSNAAASVEVCLISAEKKTDIGLLSHYQKRSLPSLLRRPFKGTPLTTATKDAAVQEQPPLISASTTDSDTAATTLADVHRYLQLTSTGASRFSLCEVVDGHVDGNV
jgi:hypothetical protein